VRTAPVAVELWRGDVVESRHRVHLMACTAEGAVRLVVGDADLPVYPRSAIKPIQALPWVAQGGLHRFGLSLEELALACASHAGEERHVRLVRAWLARLGLDPSHLVCAPHPPLSQKAAQRLAREGREPSRLHNNCSGKHAGMLTWTRLLDLPPSGYAQVHHPVQEGILALLVRLAGEDPVAQAAVDGCGVPTWPFRLRALALLAARFACGVGLSRAERAARVQILRACRRHPELVGGEGRATTRLLRALPAGVVKEGAEGVYLGFFPEAGVGLALKVEDGAARAAEVAVAAALAHLGLWRDQRAALAFLQREVFNHAGIRVGVLRPARGWPSGASAA